MANPLIPQGTLNRLLASVLVVGNPSLNVTYGYLGQELITIAPEDPASDYLGTLTGAVPSPKPYQIFTITAHLLKSQGLAQLWELQRMTSTIIGDITVTPDATTLGPYYFQNCIIQNVNELAFTGTSVDYPLVLRGTFPINSNLYV